VLKIFRVTALVAAMAAAGAGAWAGYLRLSGNFHEVAPGMLYRSAQPDAERLSNVIKTYGIRTVINLRGENADQWYLDERRVSVEAGVNYVDFGLSSGDDLTDEQLDELVTILKEAPHPVLVHCFAGADRSGLVSAAYQLVVGNLPPEEAAGQLSFWYGHFPWLRSHTAAMDRSFERLAARIAIAYLDGVIDPLRLRTTPLA
jgi:protein tyrosine/serine phosphatase